MLHRLRRSRIGDWEKLEGGMQKTYGEPKKMNLMCKQINICERFYASWMTTDGV